MSLWLEEKFINIVGSSLPYFHKQSATIYTFRCPLCGDSKKRKNKTRGYFFLSNKRYFFKCHNCNESGSFVGFLKRKYPDIYKEYQLDALRDRQPIVTTAPTLKFEPAPKLAEVGLAKISSLSGNHAAVTYCRDRQLPEKSLDYLYFTDCWTEWIQKLGWNYVIQEDNAPRLVIPWFSREGALMGAQARRIDVTGKEGRYITLKATKEETKIYGLERVDFYKPIYLVEGPLDSWFLPNCVAAMGSDLMRVRDLFLTNYSVTFVWDNEPRNPNVVHEVTEAVSRGYPVVVWPADFPHKDLNDMAKAGVDVPKLVGERTFMGLKAHLELTQWKK